MGLLGLIIGDALGEWLASGASSPERGYLIINCIFGALALTLNAILSSHNWLFHLPGWGQGSFDGLMYATLTAAGSFAYSVVHLARRKPGAGLAATCALASAAALAISFWVSAR